MRASQISNPVVPADQQKVTNSEAFGNSAVLKYISLYSQHTVIAHL